MEIYTLEPAVGRSWFYFFLFFVLLLGLMALAVHIRYAMTHTRFELDDDALRIVSGLRSKSFRYAELDVAEARFVSFEEEPALAPISRRGGTAIGDYRTGWFRLRNKEKALLYMTSRTGAVYIPTTLGYSILLSASDKDKEPLINSLMSRV